MQMFASRIHAPLRAALLDLLAAHAASAGFTALDRDLPTITVEEVAVEDWASLTFDGQRHRIELRLDGDPALLAAAGKAIAAELGQVEFTVPGHLVADIALVATDFARSGAAASRRLCIEVLTIAD